MSPSSMSGVRPMTLKADSDANISVFTLEGEDGYPQISGKGLPDPRARAGSTDSVFMDNPKC